MKEFNVLSLFDGMSCGLQALKNLGIQPTNYFASEIDKYAITIAKKNHPEIIHIGDVTQQVVENGGLLVNGKTYKIDLIIGGSPCQGFSFAGKQLNFEDPRSKLFFEFVRLKNELQPTYFLLENVKMKKIHQDVITEHLGVKPILIDSALVSAQTRKRLYWTNLSDVGQPEDLGIYLKDILETSEEYPALYLRGRGNNPGGVRGLDGKCLPLTSNAWQQNVFLVNVPVQLNPSTEAGGKQPHMQNRVYAVQGKSCSLTAAFASRLKVDTKYYLSEKLLAGFARKSERRTHLGIGFDTLNIRDLEGKASCLTARYYKTSMSDPYVDQEGIRKLTPLECERLQTLPDRYTEGVSDTQRYKMLGNGWTVKVIEHILRSLKSLEQL